MQLAARTAAWAKSGGWVNPYVTDGLVGMWDGEWNAGGGYHEPNATVWKDLAGDGDFSILQPSKMAWHERSASFDGSYRVAETAGDFSDCKTIEIVVRPTGNNTGNIVSFSTGIDNRVFPVVNRRQNGGMNLINAGRSFYAELNEIVHGAYIKTNDSLFKNGVTANVFEPSGFVDIYRAKGISGDTEYHVAAEIYVMRLYNRALTPDEIAANYAVDKARFNLP